MAKEKQKEPKIILEREYIVPLRIGWLKVAEFKRANRAVKELKKFLVKHMKIYDRDLRKVKIDNVLNNELRFRGMRKPPAKIRVLAKKFDDGIVKVYLVDIPEHIKYARLREAKIKKEVEKNVEKIEENKEEVKETKDTEVKDNEKIEDAKEMEETSKEASMKISEDEAKQQKHVAKERDMQAKQNIGGKRSQRGR
jgi:large subunit ribosomal protein L31e